MLNFFQVLFLEMNDDKKLAIKNKLYAQVRTTLKAGKNVLS